VRPTGDLNPGSRSPGTAERQRGRTPGTSSSGSNPRGLACCSTFEIRRTAPSSTRSDGESCISNS